MGRILVTPPALALLGVAFLILGCGFIFGADWATWLWPDKGPWTDPLSFLFVGSMLAAVGSAAVYSAWIGDARSSAGGTIALFVLTSCMAIAILLFWLGGMPGLGWHALFLGLGSFVLWMMMVASLSTPQTDRRSVPVPVRAAFWLFAVVLLATGVSLILRLPNVFPWPLQPISSVLYGCMFLGFAANYAYVAVRGTMNEAKISLLGFVVYDLVLIGPFARHFGTVAPAMRTSLIVYTTVLVFSAIVAVYCFAVDRSPRQPTSAS